MATIDEYASGKAAKRVKMAVETIRTQENPLLETKFADMFAKNVREMDPVAVNGSMASEYILGAERCAIGDRVCQCEFPDAPATCAVFLDELADAMVKVGRAVYASKDEATTALSRHKGRPLVVTKVSGRYMEICRTWPGTCFYWNLEDRGMKCLKKLSSGKDE
jgi:hypothetical protein